MKADHQPQVPVVFEQLLTGLSELELLLGDAGKPVIGAVRSRLRAASAARDRGDPVAMLDAVSAAMRDLAALGERLGPGEGRLMTALAQRFRDALLRGDLAEAKKGMDVMFEQSGARYQGGDD
jgi:hypothetical protein